MNIHADLKKVITSQNQNQETWSVKLKRELESSKPGTVLAVKLNDLVELTPESFNLKTLEEGSLGLIVDDRDTQAVSDDRTHMNMSLTRRGLSIIVQVRGPNCVNIIDTIFRIDPGARVCMLLEHDGIPFDCPVIRSTVSIEEFKVVDGVLGPCS